MTNRDKTYEQKTPIDKKIFAKFINDEMTVKEVKAFTDELTKRFYYIVHEIAQVSGRIVDWFDYDNQDGEDNPGSFDTDYYKDTVGYTGEFITKDKKIKEPFEDYDTEFPTEWFYTNFEEQLVEEKNQFFEAQAKVEKEKAVAKEKSKNDVKKVQDSIRAKLTTEELAYIAFLSPEEVRKNKTVMSKVVSSEVAKFIKDMKKAGIDISAKYQEYRKDKKNPQKFEDWVVKNKSAFKKLLEWPFPVVPKN